MFLAKDDAGIVQAFFVAPHGGAIRQVTRHTTPIQSCVRWSPDGAQLLYVCGDALTVCDARGESKTFGEAKTLTKPSMPTSESAVWSHDGRIIAFNRRVLTDGRWQKQIFLVQP